MSILNNDKLNELLHQDCSNNNTLSANRTLLNIQEQDRQRIAREIHDTSLQNLTHLIHKIELSSMYIDKDPNRAKLELALVNQKLKVIIDDIRDTIFDLRPMAFDDLEMKEALANLLNILNESKKYDIDVEIENPLCKDEIILLGIYRIIQEIINNIEKHSGANKIIVHCKNIESFYEINISDNGIGFSVDEMENIKDNHFGLFVMRDRVCLLGGIISISSTEGTGTNIYVKIPLK